MITPGVIAVTSVYVAVSSKRGGGRSWLPQPISPTVTQTQAPVAQRRRTARYPIY